MTVIEGWENPLLWKRILMHHTSARYEKYVDEKTQNKKAIQHLNGLFYSSTIKSPLF